MNDAETSSRTYRSRVESGRLERRRGQPHPARVYDYTIAPGRIEGQGRRGKPLIADYVLEDRNTKLAFVEAKARDQPLTEGVAQAGMRRRLASLPSS